MALYRTVWEEFPIKQAELEKIDKIGAELEKKYIAGEIPYFDLELVPELLEEFKSIHPYLRNMTGEFWDAEICLYDEIRDKPLKIPDDARFYGMEFFFKETETLHWGVDETFDFHGFDIKPQYQHRYGETIYITNRLRRYDIIKDQWRWVFCKATKHPPLYAFEKAVNLVEWSGGGWILVLKEGVCHTPEIIHRAVWVR